MNYREKAHADIQNLFSGKLIPAIADKVQARDEIRAQRKDIEASRQGFLKKIESTAEAIKVLETSLDDKIISGKAPDEVLSKIATRQAEKTAYERHIQRLADQDIEAEAAEKNANRAISEAIGKQLEALRPDVEALIRGKLEEVLGTLIYFEHIADKTADENGVSLSKEVSLSVFRFLSFDKLTKDLQAYLGSIGEDFSAVRRREVMQIFFAESETKEAA